MSWTNKRLLQANTWALLLRSVEPRIGIQNIMWYVLIADRKTLVSIWSHMIARSQLIADDRKRSQKIEHGSIFCDRLQSSAIKPAFIWIPFRDASKVERSIRHFANNHKQHNCWWKWRMIIAVNFQFKQLEKEAWKKSGQGPPSNVWLHSSVGRASHRYRGGHGFESRWSPDFFQASSFQLLKLEN